MSEIQTPGDRRPTDQRTSVGPETGAFARWCTRALDGRREWGSIDFSPTQHGVTRYRLVVFPPGIDSVERRYLRAWRAWSTWGAVVWLMMLIVLSVTLTPGIAFATSSVAYLGVGAALLTRVAELRCRVPTLIVVRIAGYADEGVAALFAELKSLVVMLCQADDRRDRGQSSPADHEAAWWQVYERLGEICPGTVKR